MRYYFILIVAFKSDVVSSVVMCWRFQERQEDIVFEIRKTNDLLNI